MKMMVVDIFKRAKLGLSHIDREYNSKIRVLCRKFFGLRKPLEETVLDNILISIDEVIHRLESDIVSKTELFNYADQLYMWLMILIATMPREFSPAIDDIISDVSYCQSVIKQRDIYE